MFAKVNCKKYTFFKFLKMHILNSLINWLYLFFLDVCVWVRAVGGDETADHLSFYSYIRLGETCGEMMLANAKLIDDGVRRQ